MQMTPARERTIAHRLEEGAREMGVLLMVFAPLDYAFANSSEHASVVVLFFGAGLVVFSAAVISEIRRGGVD